MQFFLLIFTEPGKHALAHPCTYTKLLHKHAPRMRIWAGPPSLPAYCMLRQTGNDCGVTLFHRLLTLARSTPINLKFNYALFVVLPSLSLSLQGSAERRASGCLNTGWENYRLCPAAGRSFQLIFTQPGAHVLVA